MFCSLIWAGHLKSNITEMNHRQETFRDLKVIIALHAVLSIQSTQQRPVCRDKYPSFYKGILFYSLLTLGTLSETQHRPPVYFCICLTVSCR